MTAKVFIQNLSVSIISLVIFLALGEIATRIIAGSPLITQPDPVLFWKYKPNQTGHQKLYSPLSRVDKNGFRYSGTDYEPGRPSIYIGGDSYAWGEGVSDAETFPAQFQSLLEAHNLKYNMLNGGVPGYGIEQIINRMQAECKIYKPKYAVFVWVESDMDRLRDISPLKKKIFLRDYKLRSMFRYSAFLKVIKEQIFDKLLHKDLGLGFYGDRNLEYRRTHVFNEKIVGITQAIKNNIYFLRERDIIPIWVIVVVPSKEFRDYLYSLSKELSVVLIDPEPAYRKYFPDLKGMATNYSGHFKPQVYGLLAEEVINKVSFR